MSEQNSFKFKNGEIQIEFSGERSFVESQISEWRDYIKNNLSDLNQINSNNFEEKKEPVIFSVKNNISINDFIELKKPINNEDLVLIAGYYLERYEKYSSFSEIDILKKINIENSGQYLAINMEKGYLSLNRNNNTNEYTLTYSGESYVKDGLEHY